MKTLINSISVNKGMLFVDVYTDHVELLNNTKNCIAILGAHELEELIDALNEADQELLSEETAGG